MTRSYQNFLILQIAYMVSFPIVSMGGIPGKLIDMSFGMGILILGLWLFGEKKRHVARETFIAVLLVALWVLELTQANNQSLALLRESILILFYGRLTLVMAGHVFFSPDLLMKNRLYGAVSIYLMISAFFGVLYSLISLMLPNAFNCLPTVCNGDIAWYFQNGGDLYFSMITLTTLGYGDITPVHPLAGMLCSLEAVIGQMYVAVVIGRLVGLHLTETQNPQTPHAVH